MALSKIDISKTGITGTLAAANGGTGATSYSPGKVLQTVQGTSSYQKSSTSTSFVDVESSSSTTWETAITPAAASSKILISASIPVNVTGSGNQDNRAYLNLSGKIGSGAYSVLVNYHRTGTYMYAESASTSAIASFNYLWTSNTTDECKIKFQLSSYASTSATVYVPSLSTETMVVILQEIGA